jgi:hypothetical protein
VLRVLLTKLNYPSYSLLPQNRVTASVGLVFLDCQLESASFLSARLLRGMIFHLSRCPSKLQNLPRHLRPPVRQPCPQRLRAPPRVSRPATKQLRSWAKHLPRMAVFDVRWHPHPPPLCEGGAWLPRRYCCSTARLPPMSQEALGLCAPASRRVCPSR